MPHVVLLGDSIFDNAAYTRGEPDVVSHLRPLLGPSWKATLVAVDGATTAGLRSQLARVPADASQLLVSIGGNDALQNSDLLNTRVKSSAETLALFAERLDAFEALYRAGIDAAIALGKPVTVCTIYNGMLAEPDATLARVGLMTFNDVILRTAFDRRLDVLELRQICCEREDYANPIEPSGPGGLKIAKAIARAIGAVDERTRPSRVWSAVIEARKR